MIKDFCIKPYLSALKLITLLSSFFVLSTIYLGVSNLERLSSFCICKVNYLAYSWISFAITILLSLIGLFLKSSFVKNNDCRLTSVDKINFVLVIAGFICGLILLIVFAGYILNIL